MITRKYRLFVKYRGCHGNSCRRCEEHLTGFWSEHDGSYEFSEWVLRDRAAYEVVDAAITDCPAGCLGWEEVGR